MNLSLAAWLALQHTHNAISVADATTRPTSLYASTETSPSLLRQFMKVQGIHRAFEPDVEVSNVPFRNRDDSDASESQPLEEAGGVFLIAREPIQRLGEYDVKASGQSGAQQRLKARPHQRGAGHCGVVEVGNQGPALALGELTTRPLLVGDRGRALLVG